MSEAPIRDTRTCRQKQDAAISELIAATVATEQKTLELCAALEALDARVKTLEGNFAYFDIEPVITWTRTPPTAVTVDLLDRARDDALDDDEDDARAEIAETLVCDGCGRVFPGVYDPTAWYCCPDCGDSLTHTPLASDPDDEGDGDPLADV